MPRFFTPTGMSRRHFLNHLAGASAFTLPALTLTRSIEAAAPALKRRHKSAILLWMGGGPPTIDLWDLKPGAPTGGPSKTIATSGDLEISSLMPEMAKQMHHYAVVRSMSTREADHMRGTYYLHTGYVPNPNVVHPSYGAMVAHELEPLTQGLEVPPFVSIGGPSEGPGFLGMAYAPFQVDQSGAVRNLSMPTDPRRMADRIALLDTIESRFVAEKRGGPAEDHAKVLAKTRSLLTSKQMEAFRVQAEPAEMVARYGDTGFGRGCLLARRLVEAGVPFVEVDFGGWDLHQNCFDSLERKLPEMDKAMAALTQDLEARGMLGDTLILWMGEFGRTPAINSTAGRDHYARAWSAVVGGAGVRGGQAIGKTSADGARVETTPYSAEDLMASACQALGISLQTTYTSNNGRPMKIAGGGKPIAELFA